VQIHVNSDKTITMDSRLVSFVRGEAERALGRYEGKLTRVEFHLSDVNSHKSGALDKRCSAEARPAGHQPLAVTMAAANVRSAVHGSLSKLQSALERHFGRSTKGSKVRHEGPHPEDLRAKDAARQHTRSATADAEPARRVAAKKSTAKEAGSPRTAKKKAIYQARRKSWPARRTAAA
jgi:hypothetical protein